ncbi:hypothetical protein [Haloferula sp.]|uniref:hypothetical protein n=1 Tax=Haloferula sp. TaxID=2497595 RepID=UPI003C74E026
MNNLPLIFENGHLFTILAGESWLIDTGAPDSFGEDRELELAEQTFKIAPSFMGLDAEQLTRFVDTPCRGLLGGDVLGAFDMLFNVTAGHLTLSEDQLDHPGSPVELDSFMGIPIVELNCSGRSFRFFFDTGAQISYLQDDLLLDYPALGDMKDFYPGFGEFETPTHEVALELAGIPLIQRCGRLPGLLGMSLGMADVEGVLGNAFMANRLVGYFPRRMQLRL